jgi:hypothetical protein
VPITTLSLPPTSVTKVHRVLYCVVQYTLLEQTASAARRYSGNSGTPTYSSNHPSTINQSISPTQQTRRSGGERVICTACCLRSPTCKQPVDQVMAQCTVCRGGPAFCLWRECVGDALLVAFPLRIMSYRIYGTVSYLPLETGRNNGGRSGGKTVRG